MHRLHLDCDGVLADFDTRATAVLGLLRGNSATGEIPPVGQRDGGALR